MTFIQSSKIFFDLGYKYAILSLRKETGMRKITVKTPKARNTLVPVLRSGMFRKRVEDSKKSYNRKKYKNKVNYFVE